MTGAWKILRYTTFALAALFAVFGTAFIVGEALTDPGGVSGLMISAAWCVPMAALAVYALLRPASAVAVLMPVAVFVASFVLIDGAFGILPRDAVGPVGAIAVFAVAVPLGFLAAHRPVPAGWLLLLLGAASLAGVFLEALGTGDARPAGGALGGSSAAVAVPVLLIGGLFLVAGYGVGKTGGGQPGAPRHDPASGSPLGRISSRR
jgi:hypothetical protein